MRPSKPPILSVSGDRACCAVVVTVSGDNPIQYNRQRGICKVGGQREGTNDRTPTCGRGSASCIDRRVRNQCLTGSDGGFSEYD